MPPVPPVPPVPPPVPPVPPPVPPPPPPCCASAIGPSRKTVTVNVDKKRSSVYIFIGLPQRCHDYNHLPRVRVLLCFPRDMRSALISTFLLILAGCSEAP